MTKSKLAMVKNLYTKNFRILALPTKKLRISPEIPIKCSTYGTEQSWDFWRVEIFVMEPEVSIYFIKTWGKKIFVASHSVFFKLADRHY